MVPSSDERPHHPGRDATIIDRASLASVLEGEVTAAAAFLSLSLEYNEAGRLTRGGNAVMVIVEVAAGVLLLIGFICGYGVREFISRHRRATARRRDFERLTKEVAQTRNLIAARPEDRCAIGFRSSDGARVSLEDGSS
jgi:hypothetical protein